MIKVHKIIKKRINGEYLNLYDIQTFNEWSYSNSFSLENKENEYIIYKVIGLFNVRRIYYRSFSDYKIAVKEYNKLTLKEIDNMITWKSYI